ncbi:F0F1 ATP synthase subunit B family protein [Desulfogranum japonicum]|uniref:F0F1 ATP synthase subunit B family protein n=1 Tax=Desulfogranum japonicum TaxID=231447 RepID=UPI0004150FCF|nr:ATP synthase F0 subunit B [Desulfogranum japonicum]
MRSRIVGTLLPILMMVLVVGTASSVLASAQAHGDDAHAVAAAHNEQAVHEATHEDDAGALTATHEEPTAHQAEVHAEEGHGEAHGGSLSPAKLKDLFWRAVNFLALLVLLVYFLNKPIVSGLSGRQKQIKEELETLEAQKEEAQAEYASFESRLAGMEKEMESVVARAIAQAENEKQRILDEAERAAEDIKRNAEASILAEVEEAKRLLRDEVAEKATAMAEEIIAKNLTSDDQVAITEQFLERVGAVQ